VTVMPSGRGSLGSTSEPACAPTSLPLAGSACSRDAIVSLLTKTLTHLTEVTENVTECYLWVTLHSFGAILWSVELSMVFSGYDDLSML
jgi:hypothetical protein